MTFLSFIAHHSAAHYAARAATPGGIVFRPARLTVPGVPSARISDCWAFTFANPTFQMEKPLDCSRENQNILLGSQKTFGVAWSSIEPAAAAATATAVKPVDQQPKQTSQVVQPRYVTCYYDPLYMPV
ncbi:unnamed protein product [Dibothriocephalus latus]|uniref:Uncharacterized protein n=1 Tax=Dibothriocephalus latus TaxID=60516 RepID=A0A3P7MS08_DIBLA|nr:unnamed protein product [Dibothriocephalus latus]